VVDRVVLVRHGETEWSRDGRHTGRTDVPLTLQGRREAELAGGRLASLMRTGGGPEGSGGAWTLVLTSPRQRATETCRLAGLGDAAEIDPDLEEWDYGEYEGLTTPEILARRPTWSLWSDGCPGGERPAGVAARADRVIARCQAVDGDAVLFAHGHVLRVLGARWVEAEPAFGAHLALSTASISALGWERATPVISEWNDPPA
jgi:broad specificity phosphatase PhoE